jgi:hypothetical protein
MFWPTPGGGAGATTQRFALLRALLQQGPLTRRNSCMRCWVHCGTSPRATVYLHLTLGGGDLVRRGIGAGLVADEDLDLAPRDKARLRYGLDSDKPNVGPLCCLD